MSDAPDYIPIEIASDGSLSIMTWLYGSCHVYAHDRIVREKDDTIEALQAEVERLRADRLFLWELLDDIDTLDDAARDSDKTFRDHARRIQQRRFEISTSDGYSVKFTSAALTDPAAEEEA